MYIVRYAETARSNKRKQSGEACSLPAVRIIAYRIYLTRGSSVFSSSNMMQRDKSICACSNPSAMTFMREGSNVLYGATNSCNAGMLL